MQFRFALFAVIVVGGRFLIGDSYTEAVLPDLTLITLNKQAIRVRLIILVVALVLLEATDAARDLVFLIAGVFHRFIGVAV
jgi:hypothetical protein